MVMCWAMVLSLAAGCSTTQKRTYDVSVKNDTGQPITVWLTKDGPPVEKGWRSPEQVAIIAPGYEERIGGMPVPAGKTAYTGPLSGEFEPYTTAWLRVYEGKYQRFSDLLAVSPKSPKRVDQPLDVGKNHIVVREKNGKLFAEWETPEPATKAEK